MSEKIKVLKINKSTLDKLDETTEDFGSNGFWFEEDLDHSVSMDFDKTIALKDKKTSKIDLVQNANSHFFDPKGPKDLSFQKSDIGNKTFESINLVDKMIKPTDSLIRKEIIDMRRMSYENEQRDKEFLLNKLNVDLKPNNNFKNYNLAKNEEIITESEKVEPIKQQMDFIESQLVNLEKKLDKVANLKTFEKPETNFEPIIENVKEQVKSENKLNEEKNEAKTIDDEITQEPIEEEKVEHKINFLLKDEEVLKEEYKQEQQKQQKQEITNQLVLKEEEKNVMVKFDNEDHKQNKDSAVIQIKNNKRSLFQDMDTKELNSFFEEESKNYSLPVINNNDYTIANTVDDLEKAINNLEFGSKKIREKEKFFDQDGGTTQLVESLQITSRGGKKASLNPVNFDAFEDWFNQSKDVKKLAKLAKKENKKMNKSIKK
ncbi:hypothetical protein [Spiroplasma endosymbiont of Diplazon laetatorius]|uniref:hypothetical protein n=1 Tax=Spiroplasma endosymbiont of Diplazon laetatorius TaxID=3066322 RepID=UPI0030CC27F7